MSVENWVRNIYRVEIAGNFLATGNYNEDDIHVDYIEIVQEDEENPYNYKININGFLGSQTLDNTLGSNDGLEISISKISTYMDYQIYTFNVKNTTQNEILLDDRSNIDTLYLEDSNGLTYSAYTNELSDAQLTILPETSKNVTIKYYNKFSSEREIEKVCFSRIILNNNANQPRNYGRIEINL